MLIKSLLSRMLSIYLTWKAPSLCQSISWKEEYSSIYDFSYLLSWKKCVIFIQDLKWKIIFTSVTTYTKDVEPWQQKLTWAAVFQSCLPLPIPYTDAWWEEGRTRTVRVGVAHTVLEQCPTDPSPTHLC